MSEEMLLTTGQAGRLLGVTMGRVNQIVRTGVLPVALVLPIGKLLLRKDVERLAAQRALRRADRIAEQR